MHPKRRLRIIVGLSRINLLVVSFNSYYFFPIFCLFCKGCVLILLYTCHNYISWIYWSFTCTCLEWMLNINIEKTQTTKIIIFLKVLWWRFFFIMIMVILLRMLRNSKILYIRFAKRHLCKDSGLYGWFNFACTWFVIQPCMTLALPPTCKEYYNMQIHP
jgi:hypothetical protein